MKRVLIADDIDFIRKAYKEALKPFKVHVDEAENAVDLVKRARIRDYSMILTGHSMPPSRMTGLEGIIEIRKFNQTTPIIFISGECYEIHLAALRHGANETISKREENVGLKLYNHFREYL